MVLLECELYFHVENFGTGHDSACMMNLGTEKLMIVENA